MEVSYWYLKKIKFNDIYKSFVKVIVESKTSGTTQTLSKAPVGTVYNKVYGNNIDDDSYSESVYEGIQRLLQEPSTTGNGWFDLHRSSIYTFFNINSLSIQVFEHTIIEHTDIWTNIISTYTVLKKPWIQHAHFWKTCTST